MGVAISYRHAHDNSEVPTLLVGKDQQISYANAAAHRMLGYAQGGLIGLSLAWLAPPSRHAELSNVRAVLAGQSARRIRTAALLESGSVRDVIMRLEPCLDASGEVIGVTISYEPVASLPAPPPPPRSTRPPSAGMRSLPPAAPRTSLPPVASRPSAPSLSRASLPPTPSLPPRASLAPLAGMRSMHPSPPPANTVTPRHSAIVPRQAAREELVERVNTAQQLLRWLDERLSQPIEQQSFDDPRERARAHVVLKEVRGLLEECQRELAEGGNSAAAVLSAPRVPRV